MSISKFYARNVLLLEVEYNGEIYTTVPYKPVSSDLLWNAHAEEIIPNNYTTSLTVEEHNVSKFTLRQINFVDEKDKEILAEALGYELWDLLDEDLYGDRFDYMSAGKFERHGVTASDFGISAGSLSFTESKYIKADDVDDIETEDVVNHPNHYNHGRFETIELIEDITNGYGDGFVAYAVGNAIKYLSRAPFKHGEPTEDLRKAYKYIEFAIDYLERD